MVLPLIIRDSDFDERGFVRSKNDLLVPAYIASQFGFSTSGSEMLNSFYKRLRDEAGVLALCPFRACAENLDLVELGKLNSSTEILQFWEEFNKNVGPINYGELMPRSKLMIAILDGGHTIDEGVAAEIGHYATRYGGEKPIIGIRSDIRLAENPAAPINPAVRYFIDEGPFNGSFHSGPLAYEEAINKATNLSSLMVNGII